MDGSEDLLLYDPIEWLLLTTLAVATAEDAARMVTWYSYMNVSLFHGHLERGDAILTQSR